MRKASAVFLFAVIVGKLALMWQPVYWITAASDTAMFALAALWIVLQMTGVEEFQPGFVLYPMVCVAAWPVLQLCAGTTIYRWLTSAWAFYWAAAAAVVFAGLQIFRDPGVRKGYLRALVVLGFIMAVFGPLQLFTSGGKIFWLYSVPYANVAIGPFQATNEYAAFIELLLPVALTSVFSDRAEWRVFHGLAAAVMYASVFVATSRSGFVLTTAEVLLVPLLAAGRAGLARRRMLAYGALFLVMLVVLAFAAGPDRLLAKLQHRDPWAGRLQYAEASLRMIPDRPLMGFGMGNWPTAYPAYAVFDDGLFVAAAHNDWLQWTVEGGVPFLLLMLTVAAWSFRAAFRTGWGIGVAAVFLECCVDFPLHPRGLAILFFSLIAAMAFPEGRSGRASAKRRSPENVRPVTVSP